MVLGNSRLGEGFRGNEFKWSGRFLNLAFWPGGACSQLSLHLMSEGCRQSFGGILEMRMCKWPLHFSS